MLADGKENPSEPAEVLPEQSAAIIGKVPEKIARCCDTSGGSFCSGTGAHGEKKGDKMMPTDGVDWLRWP